MEPCFCGTTFSFLSTAYVFLFLYNIYELMKDMIFHSLIFCYSCVFDDIIVPIRLENIG